MIIEIFAADLTFLWFVKVLDKSGFFSTIPNGQFEDKCAEYFEMLDEDKDKLVGFFDFLTPIMTLLPPEVAIAFQNDQRFQQESMNDLRALFIQSRTANKESSRYEVRLSDLKTNMFTKSDNQKQSLLKNLKELMSLMKIPDD